MSLETMSLGVEGFGFLPKDGNLGLRVGVKGFKDCDLSRRQRYLPDGAQGWFRISFSFVKPELP